MISDNVAECLKAFDDANQTDESRDIVCNNAVQVFIHLNKYIIYIYVLL